MKKFYLTFFLIMSFIIYVGYINNNNSQFTPSISTVNSSNSTISVPPVQNNVSLSPGQSGQYKDGTYTGSAADAYYGNVQVQVSIQNGLIADVVFLDYPKDRQTSLQIANYAMPILKSEAITVQSSNVDTVSGATLTSQAFVQSLASALAQAKA